MGWATVLETSGFRWHLHDSQVDAATLKARRHTVRYRDSDRGGTRTALESSHRQNEWLRQLKSSDFVQMLCRPSLNDNLMCRDTQHALEHKKTKWDRGEQPSRLAPHRVRPVKQAFQGARPKPQSLRDIL